MKNIEPKTKEKILIRACHSCTRVNESYQEMERCSHCNKAFLPLRYFDQIHHAKDAKYENHFSAAENLDEEDLVRGLFVLW